MNSKKIPSSDLQQSQQELETWRKARQPGERIPEAVWTSVTALARVHGVSPVCQALRVDYYGLKRRVLGSEPVRKPQRKRVAFVELPVVSQRTASSGCVVELAQNGVRTMTIRWAGSAGSDLLALAEAFWRRES
jgi:hypothetical protein